MRPAPTREAAAAATVVFEGRVTRMTLDQPEGSFLAYHVYELDVARTWKGEPGPSVSIRTADNSAACGRAFEIGESYLVYALEVDGDLSHNQCSRTRRMAEAQEDLAVLGTAIGEPEPPPRPAAPEPPRIPPDRGRPDEPPAPSPSSGGCRIDEHPGDSPLPWLLLVVLGAGRRRLG
jgi:MYXO-CTERM domain-containing protein